MKHDVARRAALAALAAFFAYLLYLCADGRTLMKLNAEVRHERINNSLYLEKQGDGILFIGGEGTLTGQDLMALVEGEGNKNDVRELVIGDGITELGYNALIEFEGLRTLWLGRDMKTVAKGAVKGCTSLKYVFLPRGFEKCGRDFLYECGKCVVVTDGPADGLPRLYNVSKKRVLADVDSYDALKAASGKGEEDLPQGLKRWWP